MNSNRVAGYLLLLIMIFIFLKYSRLQGPHSNKHGSDWWSIGSAMRPGCPADSHQRVDLGAANYSWSLKSLTGEEISFSQFRGKTVFLNVWATWCGPCIAEMPEIQALHDSMKQDGVVFVLVSEETLDEVKPFVQEQGLTAPIYVTTSSLPDVFESDGIPATFLIDPQGRVVLRRVGAAGWDNDQCRNYLRDLSHPPQSEGTKVSTLR